MKKKEIIITSVLCVVLIIIASLLVYLNTYYKATKEVKEFLKSDDIVSVKEIKNGYFFDGPGEEKAFVFYPGAKVEYTAYAAMMKRIAIDGTDTFLVKMPFNIALFKKNAIKDLQKEYKYDKWYLGGHSLGGVVAAMATKDNDIKGLVLLASYSTKKIDCNVLTMYGSNDGVLNLKKYEDNKKNIPNNREIIIDGGNHAYFGYYGEQKGDKEATIDRVKQQAITALEIIHFIEEN